MSAAALDRLLAIAIGALAATGALSLWAGSADDAWLFLAHDLLAGMLAVLVVLKVARSVPPAVRARRWRALLVSAVLLAVVAGSLVAGYTAAVGPAVAWVDLGFVRWTSLTLHAWLGIAVLPILLVHLVPRRWRLLRARDGAVTRTLGRVTTRRAFLVGGAMAGLGVAVFGAASLAERLAGGSRRFTGSRLLPPGSMPIATTFLGEPVPAVDAATWRVRVEGRVGQPLDLSLDELRALPSRDARAVLDCTSGWAVDGSWTGAAVADLLDRAGADDTATAVEVRAVTGWSASLPIADARRSLLAWVIDGRALPVENGAPLRLVAPDHRGLEWVKWVESLRVV
jgi:DMSO/TMAO reductase YedYZ molybdopterin-dependent catalytic subunit